MRNLLILSCLALSLAAAPLGRVAVTGETSTVSRAPVHGATQQIAFGPDTTCKLGCWA